MSWEEIVVKLQEIIDLHLTLQNKLSSPIIKEIVNRKNQYCDNGHNIDNLNNAVLENKIDKTTLQAMFIAKLNEIDFLTSVEDIYSNMKDSLEENNKYIQSEKSKLEYGLFLLDLVFKIEELTDVELKEETPFENNSYAKMTNFCDSLYENLLIAVISKRINNLETYLKTKVLSYWKKLSDLEKTTILNEAICLSYDRNRFLFCCEMQRISKFCHKYPQTKLEVIVKIDKCIIELLKAILINYYYEASKEILYDDFSLFLNNQKKKEKKF